VQVVGITLIFSPLNVAAYLYLPLALRGAAVGVFNLLRNEGGSVGTSVAQTLIDRREQFHLLRLGERLDRFNPPVRDFLGAVQGYYQGQTGDPAGAQLMAMQTLANARQRQALALSYFDCFWAFAVVAVLLI